MTSSESKLRTQIICGALVIAMIGLIQIPAVWHLVWGSYEHGCQIFGDYVGKQWPVPTFHEGKVK